MRGRFTGLNQIVRFNWPFYLAAAVTLSSLLVGARLVPETYRVAVLAAFSLGFLSTVGSLGVSWYVYDLSGIYDFGWLKDFSPKHTDRILNIHAGFDETSVLLKKRFPDSEFHVFDFYDPVRNSEASIRRARQGQSTVEGTRNICSDHLPLGDQSLDMAFSILAAHEIRRDAERTRFFKELERTIKRDGRIYVMEHLRDWKNFLAFNVGFIHFHSDSTWRRNFQAAGLRVEAAIALNPFVVCYVLVVK